MRFQYKHFVIDATPDLASGQFWARARIAPGALNEDEQPPLIDQREIGRFSQKSLAVEHAINWARSWIESQRTLS
ncbi:hypothetical protein SAMN05444168_4715 [Paraburkholderia phenazinium]|jgi:hypothetical protein|uniref:Uncharacterized protein n=1 Tax=Paraburkholderia phenazinium TaxID=60549 RepID=A0A1N6JNA9_9BURK|nr:hypothetical protein SAMN05444168_4715 [Paraburkholderia phenazinium]